MSPRRLIALCIVLSCIAFAGGFTFRALFPPEVPSQTTAVAHCEVLKVNQSITLFDHQVTMAPLTSSRPSIASAMVTVGPGRNALEITTLWLGDNTMEPITTGLLQDGVNNVEVLTTSTNYDSWRIDAVTVCG